MTNSKFAFSVLVLFLLTLITVLPSTNTAAMDNNAPVSITPFHLIETDAERSMLKVRLNPHSFSSVSSKETVYDMLIPLPEVGEVHVTVEPFNIFSEKAEFYHGFSSTDQPDIRLFRGYLDDDPNSLVYLTFSPENRANGIIISASGSKYIISEGAKGSEQRQSGYSTIYKETAEMDLPDFPSFCGTEYDPAMAQSITSQFNKSPEIWSVGQRLAHLAIEGDQDYVNLFDNVTDAQNYAALMIGAVSAIYIRDFNVRLDIAFLRMWPSGGEPFDANNLGGFADYWNNNEDTTGINVVHMLSGRRNLSYGGVAFVSGVCAGEGAFSISGYLNGSFPSPVDAPNLGNWDVIVSAHEIGHNFGTFHTHDGYDPLIDSCAQGYPTLGTIMSYCHIHPGYTTNSEMRFHGRVIELVKNIISFSDCLLPDCNENGIDDAIDIATSFSSDINLNGIPDECEDCNDNGIIDGTDILNGEPDVDGNGQPDICQPDCNGNGFPDSVDIAVGIDDDENYNGVPDGCEPDCDGNSVADFLDIRNGTFTDFDRNLIPDNCQDCNGNSVIDWNDLEKQFNLFVGDVSGSYVREYHQNSGVPIQNYGTGNIINCYDIVFGSDNFLYAASYNSNSIIKIDPLNNTAVPFISGDGNLSGPSAMTFAPNGNLLIANFFTSNIVEYQFPSGVFIGEFIASVTGLSGPMGMTIGLDNHLYVSSGTSNQVLKYNGTSGALISTFVTAGLGGLSSPRGLIFDDSGNLLVCSYNTNNVLSYNGTTGAFISQFNDVLTLNNPWDITIGPNGNIFVSRSGGTPRIIEYTPSGRYYRSYVRGDAQMLQPAGIAFHPASDFDCNGNNIPDDCDITSGFSLDLNADSIPDECQSIVDNDDDGVTSDLDCDDNNPDVQFEQDWYFDSDSDGFGDPDISLFTCTPPAGYVEINTDCDDSNPDIYPDAAEICNGLDDDCNGTSDDGFTDSDADGIGDICDSCPADPDNDIDQDGLCAEVDNCPAVDNPGQEDATNDGIGDACCCLDRTGNIDGDGTDTIDIADLVMLVDYMFNSSGEVLPCPDEANIDAADSLDIADLVMLVDYMFGSGTPELPLCPN